MNARNNYCFFIEVALSDDWGAAEKIYNPITEFEHEADDLITNLRANLSGSAVFLFFMAKGC